MRQPEAKTFRNHLRAEIAGLQLRVAELSVGVSEGQEDDEWVEKSRDLSFWTRMLDVVDRMEQEEFDWKDTQITTGRE